MPKSHPIKNIDDFMDSVGDGIFVVDEKGIINKSNEAAHEMLGYSKKQDVEGHDAVILLGAIDAKGKLINKRNAALFKSIRQGKKINNAIRQFIKQDGTRIWASITTNPIKTKSTKFKGAVIIMRDITEQRQQEEYRTDFAHIASHSLRTPLGNVLWATEYLLSAKPGKINAKQKDYLQECYTTLKNMNTMINDLLSVSRLPDKKVKPNFQKVLLEDTVKALVKTYGAYAHAQNVTIKLTETDSKKKHYIKADPKYLEIIIQNLIENAVRYSFEHSDVKINIKRDKDTTTFSCTNHGIGIPKDKHGFIFAKFFRAKNAVSKQGNGTGLGLYITKEMVRLNKGEIWFESEPNKTTTFYVKFKNS